MKFKDRYRLEGSCNRCGWCCLQEDPPCPYLSQEENGDYTCDVFDNEELRPAFCKMYPSAPPILHDKCGYHFIDTLEGNKIIKRIVT